MSRLAAAERHSGFTLVELLITTMMTMVVMGAILTLIVPAQAMFQGQGEVADLHQRLRAAVEMLAADLRAARGVRPYRVGVIRDDALAGVYYRADTISVLGVPTSALSAGTDATRTYWLKFDVTTRSFELMQYDGLGTDLPAIEHVASMSFEYLGLPEPAGAGLVALAPGEFTDGPWSEDPAHRPFDVDVLRIRQVNVHLRVESVNASTRARNSVLFVHGGTSTAAERFVPDQSIDVHVALR